MRINPQVFGVPTPPPMAGGPLASHSSPLPTTYMKKQEKKLEEV